MKNEDKAPIAVGDCVYLKSGSPKMTVVALDADGGTAKVMFNPYGTVHLVTHDIPVEALNITRDYITRAARAAQSEGACGND